ncbi:Septum site-determining protein MinC [Buchnera aphidicola (Pterocallis alni)]|uniref:septum site-determining protein MinC n=1 Tax=Buchnera aphidicola TaxID=9 RepID=UPI0034643BC3
MLKNNIIEFKGNIFTLSVLYIKSDIVDLVKISILKKINQFPFFLKKTPIILNISFLTNRVDWKKMEQAICETGLQIIGIIGNINNVLKKIIIQSKIPILSKGLHHSNNKNILEKYNILLNKKNTSKIINTPVRAGQTIYVHHSDLIITNNVNAGAELIAGGNIHIYGTMRGRALAGAHGDQTRQIFCTRLFAELLSISGEYLLMDHIPHNMLGKSVGAILNNNIISVYPLS